MTDAERALWLQAKSDYTHALAIATEAWGEGADPQAVQAGAATVLIHLTKLREASHRSHPAPVAATGNGEPTAAVPTECPECGGPLVDNRGSKKNPKEPDFRCADKNCKKDGEHTTAIWLDKQKKSGARQGPYSPTEKQVAFYQRLCDSEVFTAEERARALEWLATKATRQTIKDQIDWLKRQVETRKPVSVGAKGASSPTPPEGFDDYPESLGGAEDDDLPF